MNVYIQKFIIFEMQLTETPLLDHIPPIYFSIINKKLFVLWKKSIL